MICQQSLVEQIIDGPILSFMSFALQPFRVLFATPRYKAGGERLPNFPG
jgi:hypothetical protein